MAGKKQNPWMKHLAAFWSKNKGKMSYREAMQKAKGSYSKGGKAKSSKAKAVEEEKSAAPKKKARRKRVKK